MFHWNHIFCSYKRGKYAPDTKYFDTSVEPQCIYKKPYIIGCIYTVGFWPGSRPISVIW
jgi:hypothetical protein